MVNGLVLRLDNYEEETIIIMYSPDLPKCLPIFAIFSIAWVYHPFSTFSFSHFSFKFSQIPKIGQWFQLHIQPQQFSMDRLQQYLCSHNFPFMECRHPPQPLQLIDSPIWPISRVKNDKVQVVNLGKFFPKYHFSSCSSISKFVQFCRKLGQFGVVPKIFPQLRTLKEWWGK